jgi:hypothetical protein
MGVRHANWSVLFITQEVSGQTEVVSQSFGILKRGLLNGALIQRVTNAMVKMSLYVRIIVLMKQSQLLRRILRRSEKPWVR